MAHTGLVYKVDNLQVYTVEGNTTSAKGVVPNGGCVRLKSYKLTSSSIDGYGRPAYTAEELGTVQPTIEKTIMFVDNVGYDGLKVRNLKDDSIIDNIPIGSTLRVIKILEDHISKIEDTKVTIEIKNKEIPVILEPGDGIAFKYNGKIKGIYLENIIKQDENEIIIDTTRLVKVGTEVFISYSKSTHDYLKQFEKETIKNRQCTL